MCQDRQAWNVHAGEPQCHAVVGPSAWAPCQVGNGIRLDDAESPLELQDAWWEDGLDLLRHMSYLDWGGK